MILQGKSNTIQIIKKSGRKRIQKSFSKKLRMYDVFWPISRFEVECFTHKLVSEFAKDDCYFHQPAFISSDNSKKILTLEYIDAQPLMSFFKCSTHVGANASADALYPFMLPTKKQFSNLISILHKINHYSFDTFSEYEKALLRNQDEIVRCMYHNKLKDQVCPLTKPPWYFCLGDVSLNNILFDGKQFTLLDFECAHMGYLGYDIGQLLGMTIAHEKQSAMIADHMFSQNLLQAITETISDSNELSEIFIWANRFERYYFI